MATTLSRDVKTPADRITPAEWTRRTELAAFYRLVHHFGWTDLIYNHISARIPDDAGAYLVNAYGLMFDEITAANLLTVGLTSGAVLPRGGATGTRNEAVHVLHGSVLNARPDLACVAHVHTPAIMAVAAMDCGLLPITQTAMGLIGRIGYHDYGFDDGACVRLARDFADADVVILRHHGVLIGGRTIQEAFLHLHNFEFACKAQVAAMAGGDHVSAPPAAVLEQHSETMDGWFARRGGPLDGENCTEWQACIRLLDRLGIDYIGNR